MIRVQVPLAGRAYDVLVGAGAADAAGRRAARGRPAGRGRHPGRRARPVDPGPARRPFEVGDGEGHKTLATVEELCRAFARGGLTRADCVVAVGGGLVTDVAGFAAAIYHRGVAVVHVPTTLLGMVDAAIGGKTGVNLPEGKNLVGAFWQPAAVLCDTDVLATLPARECRSGLGEMAKYHFLAGDDLLALPIDERVAACVAIKAEVVAATSARSRPAPAPRARDPQLRPHPGPRPRDRRGPRPAPRRGGRHRPRLRRRAGRRARPHRPRPRGRAPPRAWPRYGLAPVLPPGSTPTELVALMGRDKKAIDGLTFVLDGPRGVEVVAGVAAAARRGGAGPHGSMSR